MSKVFGDTTRRLAQGLNNTKGKGNNLTNTRKQGFSQTKDPEEQKKENCKVIFDYKLPEPIRKRDAAVEVSSEMEAKIKTEKKDEAVTQYAPTATLNESVVNPSINIKKEDSNTEGPSANEIDVSDDDYRRRGEIRRREATENELAQNVYITLSETPTNFMYFLPSTKYLTIKNEHEEKEEKRKEEYYKAYLNKRKNKESFVTKGAQTINKFKRNQLVSTASVKDHEIENTKDQKVNALNWHILDSLQDESSKKDDEGKIMQRKLERKIKKELKQKLKASKDLVDVDETMTIQKSQISGENASYEVSKVSNSIYSTRKPRVRGTALDRSQIKDTSMAADRSLVNERSRAFGQTSPSSSQIRIHSHSNEPGGVRRPVDVHQTNVMAAFNEELPRSITNALRYVERLLSQNKFHFRQIAYKKYPISSEEFTVKKEIKKDEIVGINFDVDKDEEQDIAQQNIKKELELIENKKTEPDIKKLFTFSIKGILKDNNISSRYVVHCMDWNTYNEELLAAAYGDPDIDSKNPGFLCFWTLKNPLHPERVIKTPRGLTFCNFSQKSPYLITTSDYSGEVMIFDLRSLSDKPIADSTEIKDKHTDIVWECKWITRMNDKNESIVSISSDGKVKEWSLKKGLEVIDILKMKKNTSFPSKPLNPFAKYERKTREKDAKEAKDSLVFRDANGLSFDFPKNDSTIYYIALEECTIHRCRISYKDQYTDNYYGHQGPVFKIRCNPFDPNILISCSYDWTVKIWNNRINYPYLNLHSNELTHQVNDIEWSPDTSTIFGCVSDDGRIEIWDLARRAIQPTIIYKEDDNTARKSIKFSPTSQIVSSGSADGDIDVFRLYNLEHAPVSDDDQRKRLLSVLSKNSDIISKV